MQRTPRSQAVSIADVTDAGWLVRHVSQIGEYDHFKSDFETTDRWGDPVAPRGGPGRSLASRAGFSRSGGTRRRARAEKGRARRLGRSSARQARPRGHVGRGAVVGRRALLAKVDLDDLHHADAP